MSKGSLQLFPRAEAVMPGGVNSPVRAFGAVGGHPVFIKSAKGCWLYDEDGNRYLDTYNSWGPMILGYGHPRVVEAVTAQAARGLSFGAPTELEVRLAELVVELVPSVEMVRMVNSGTEACLSALRVARAATRRDYVIKFEGCYHGHHDAFLSKAGSGAATLGVPTSPGVPSSVAAQTLNARFNDPESVAALFRAYPHQIAAVIVEPVAGNMGCVPPRPGFLHGLRDLCDEHGALLIFDEVMTGFRLGLGGAQTLFRITPDLTTLGKVLGGGLPVGAYGGRRDLMELVAPRGPVYQAGTLSGNPLGMAAGLATLEWLRDHPQIYLELEKRVTGLAQSVRRRVAEKGWPVTVQSLGSMITVFFTEEEVRCWDEANRCDRQKFGEFFHALLRRGIHLPPSQFESWFLSAALGEDEWLFLEGAILKSLEEVLRTTS